MACDPLGDLRAWQQRLERLSRHHSDSWAPPIDVYETSDAYVVTAELPGLTRDQVNLAHRGCASDDPGHARSAAGVG